MHSNFILSCYLIILSLLTLSSLGHGQDDLLSMLQKTLPKDMDFNSMKRLYVKTLAAQEEQLKDHILDCSGQISSSRLLDQDNFDLFDGVYLGIDRVQNITPERFQKDYLFTGKPVIITDVAKGWKLRNFKLSDFSTYLGDLNAVASPGKAQLSGGLKKAEKGDLVMKQLKELVSLRKKGESDQFYWKAVQNDEKQSLLSRDLYNRPYFLNSSHSWTPEFLVFGQENTGFTSETENMCSARWIYQVRGQTAWTISPSVPAMEHLGSLEFILQEGETLILWPDIKHSTRCLQTTGGSDCLAFESLIHLEYNNNVYLQKHYALVKQKLDPPPLVLGTIAKQAAKMTVAALMQESMFTDNSETLFKRCPLLYRWTFENCDNNILGTNHEPDDREFEADNELCG